MYNNEMNDFSIPKAASDGLLPAPANFVAPKKSPISSMAPIIILDANKDVSLVIGGAGGILIMTSIVQVLLSYLFFNQSLKDSINSLRLHHQLQPMRIRYEKGFDENILKFLEEKGHTLDQYPDIVTGFAAVVAIANKNGKVEAATDDRRGGAYEII
jgi:gamma-glutamyltranspeptidase / glutathione hydrolase / leukotriene-C4 hydrolase